MPDDTDSGRSMTELLRAQLAERRRARTARVCGPTPDTTTPPGHDDPTSDNHEDTP